MSRNTRPRIATKLGAIHSPKPKQKRVVNKQTLRDVLRRDGCCLYGWKYPGRHGACDQALDPHHMETRGSGGDDLPENLITLCRRHHNLSHLRTITIEELRGIMTELYGYRYD